MLTGHFSEHTIAARTHGRYLVREGPSQRLLVGFHGYAESAEAHMAELQKIRGSESWTLVAVQALNRFYARERIVANWMTSQDRELAIEDNIAYVRANLPPVRLGRGTRDEWYTAEKFEQDLKVLEPMTTVTRCVFEGAHEWNDEFRAAAAEFLARLGAL